MEIKLKPCPFCGAVPVFKERGYMTRKAYPDDRTWDIACNTPECFMELGADFYMTQAELAAMWNRRVVPKATSLLCTCDECGEKYLDWHICPDERARIAEWERKHETTQRT